MMLSFIKIVLKGVLIMYKILIIDEDVKYLDSMYEKLSDEYEVTKTSSVKEAINFCGSIRYDLIIIEYNMKEMSGLFFSELIQDLFNTQRIIIISGTANVEDKVNILDSDVVDYIDKSTETEVFLKRIERLVKQERPVEILFSKKENLTVDVKNKTVHQNHQLIHLSGKEFDLLAYILGNKGQVLDRDDIYKCLWGDLDPSTNLRVVDVHILKLRQKLDLKCLQSERGVGYRWQE